MYRHSMFMGQKLFPIITYRGNEVYLKENNLSKHKKNIFLIWYTFMSLVLRAIGIVISTFRTKYYYIHTLPSNSIPRK